MNLTYGKLRKVLSVFLKNEKLREALKGMLNRNEIEITELEFLDLLEASKVDVEILEILTGKKVESLSAEDAIGVFADFFCSITSSWQKFKPLLSSLGLKVEATVKTTSKD